MMTPAPVVTKQKSGYLPSLDGWRALAILGVLMTHDTPWVLGGHSNVGWKGYGGLGVNLFFTISGILITTRILEEESLVGFFDIRRFYIRRFFRIQPVAFVYLFVTAMLILGGVIHEHWFYWLAALGMFENFTWHGVQLVYMSFFSGHFWTLAVEEHFYILLSLFLLLVRKHRFWIMLAIFVVLHVAHKVALSHGWVDDVSSPRRTYWVLNFLLLPAACAVALRWPRVRALVQKYLHPWTGFLLCLGIILANLVKIHVRHPDFVLFSQERVLDCLVFLTRFGSIVMVVATMLHPAAWTTRALEWGPLRFIGKLSYSLYLWHLLFFSRVQPDTNVTNGVLQALSGRPMKYIAAMGVAILSYYFIEKPMMRLGHRLAPPARPGRPELDDEPATVPAATA